MKQQKKRNIFSPSVILLLSLRHCEKSRPNAKNHLVVWISTPFPKEDQYITFYLSVLLKESVLDGGIFICLIMNGIIGLISEFEIIEGFLTEELVPRHSMQWIYNKG